MTVEWFVSSAVLLALLIGLRFLLKGRIGLRLQYALWLVALVRLLLPVSLGSTALSVLNALPAETPAAQAVAAAPAAYDQALAAQTVPVSDPQPEPVAGTRPASVAETTAPASAYPAAQTVPSTYPQPEPVAGTRPASVTESTAPTHPVDWLRLVWLAGVLAVGLWLLVGNLRFALRLRRSRRPFDTALTKLPVYVTEAVETPCLFGLFRPTVYLTPEAAEDESALRHVLAHEETHFRHGDHVWGVLRGLCLALHWFDPLVWWAAFLSRRDGELACDEAAIRRLGEDERAAYGRTLIGLTCEKRPALLLTATTMTGSRGGIRERIVLLAKKPRTAVYTLAAVLLLLAVAVGCTMTGRQEAGVGLFICGDGSVWRQSADTADSGGSGIRLVKESGKTEAAFEGEASSTEDMTPFAFFCLTCGKERVLRGADQSVWLKTSEGITSDRETACRVSPLSPLDPLPELPDQGVSLTFAEPVWNKTIGFYHASVNVTQTGEQRRSDPRLYLSVLLDGKWYRVVQGYGGGKPVSLTPPEETITRGLGLFSDLDSTYTPLPAGRYRVELFSEDDGGVNTDWNGWDKLLAVREFELVYTEEGCRLLFPQAPATPEEALAALFAGNMPPEMTLTVYLNGSSESLEAQTLDERNEQRIRALLQSRNWEEIAGPDPEKLLTASEEQITLFGDHNAFMAFFPANGGTILYSPDGGLTVTAWQAQENVSTGEDTITDLLRREYDALNAYSTLREALTLFFAGEEAPTLGLTWERDENTVTEYARYALTDWYEGRFNVLLGGYRWEACEFPDADALKEGADYWLTLGSADGGALLRLYSQDGGTLVYSVGEDLTLQVSGGPGGVMAAKNTAYRDGTVLAAWRVADGDGSIMDDIRTEYDTLQVDLLGWHVTMGGDGAKDASEAVTLFLRDVCLWFTNLEPLNGYGLLDCELVRSEITAVSEDGRAVLGSFLLAGTPKYPDSPLIWAGNTTSGEDKYEGKVLIGREYVLQKEGENGWRCTDIGTGGVRLPETAAVVSGSEELQPLPTAPADRLCLALLPTGVSAAADDYRYLILPEEAAALYEQAAAEAAGERDYLDGDAPSGLRLYFDENWSEFTAEGVWIGYTGRSGGEAAAELFELCREAARKAGYGEPVRPEELHGIRSATLSWLGTRRIVYGPYLTELEELLADSIPLFGASCWFTATLTLELEDGSERQLAMATDSCGTWMSNGVCYRYASDNLDFYALFAPEPVKEAAKQGVLQALCLLPEIDWSAYARAAGDGAALKLMEDLKNWCLGIPISATAAFEAERRNRLFFLMNSTGGLDGAYTEKYAAVLRELYDAAPGDLARVVLEELDEGQRSEIANLLAYEWNTTPREALARLETTGEDPSLTVTLPTTTLAEVYALPDFSVPALEWEGRLYVETAPLYPGADFSPPEAVDKLLGYTVWENGERIGAATEGFRADYNGWYYTLKGLDTERFLGRLDASGVFRLFVCRSGLTVSSGADVLEGLLHTGEQFTGFAYQSAAALREGDNTLSLLPDDEAAQRFLSALDAARPISWEALKDSLGPRESMPQALYTLYYRRADGCSLLWEFCEGGYCHVPGFEVYLQPEAAACARFLALLEEELGRVTTEPEATRPTLEDLRSDPRFGPWVPAYFPPDLDEVTVRASVLVEAETARVTGWESVNIELYHSSGGRLLQLDLLPWELVSVEDKARKPLLDLEELSVEAIENASDHHRQEDGEVWTTEVLFRFDGLAMQFSSLGLTPQEVYEILGSIGR